MRKVIVLSFITLDGVMQAISGPQEDTSGGFKFGGWLNPYSDEFLFEVMNRQMGHSFDLLLGRKTYEIFASYWPMHNDPKDPIGSGINKATKLVASHSQLKSDWAKTVVLQGDVAEAIKKAEAARWARASSSREW
jgi:dihydrofolate reductase